MADSVDLLKEVDRVLTRTTIRYPDSWKLLWKLHKHVKHIINFPEDHKASVEKTLKKTRDWLIACLVNHPMFDEDFRPVANEITDYLKDRQKI